MLRALAAGLILMAAGRTLWSQPASYEGRIIRTIQFVPSDQPLDPEEIHAVLPMKVRTPLQLADVRLSIERLFASGAYADIRVDAELDPAGEVIVRFLTESSWFIGGVSVEGSVAEPPNNGQMAAAAGLQLGEQFNELRVREGVESIKNLLEQNGYYEHDVSTRYEYLARNQQILVHFIVEGGRRAIFAPPVVTGDGKLPPAEIVKATRWKRFTRWRPATQRRFQVGLRRVREKLQAEDRMMATVSAESIDYNDQSRRLTATLNVVTGPKVEVNVIGAKISRSKLRRYIPIYEESTVDRDLLVEGVRNLKDYFQAEGYFDVEVEFKQQRIINDKAVIDYLVNLGRRHRLDKITILGNRYFDVATIRERMYLLESNFQFRRGRFSGNFLRRDEESIANLYRENGFRDVKVTHTIDNPPGKGEGSLAVTVRIEEGQQWFVSDLNLTGMAGVKPDEMLGSLSSTPGQPFSEFSVAVDRDTILARYFAEGFSTATFEWTVEPAAEPNRVKLNYKIGEGPRRFVKQVLVSGLTSTREELVNRNLGITTGDPLSPTRIADTQKGLYDLGVFARVNTAIQNPDGESSEKFVLYDVEEARRWSFTGGLGAEIARIGGSRLTYANPGGSANFAPRVSFDITRLNFRGIGHTVSLKTRVSSLNRRALATYSAPRLRNQPGLNLTFSSLYDDSLDVRTFTARRREGSVQLTQRLSKVNTALYRFSYRRVTVGDVRVIQLPILSAPARIGIAAASFVQDRRDDPVDARKGIYNTADFGYASKIFGSQADFTRFLGRNSTYYSIGKRLVVARSIAFGWLQPFALRTLNTGELTATQDIPFAERFFSGGGNSHRGFPENQAGPRDETTGFPLGGLAVLTHSLEGRFPLLGDSIGGVVFHDAGNVYSKIGNISFRVKQRDEKDFDYMVHAVGFGVRYRTPIGPVRLDLAYGLNSPRFFGCGGTPEQQVFECVGQSNQRISRFQFHFSIGQAF